MLAVVLRALLFVIVLFITTKLLGKKTYLPAVTF